MSPDGAGWYGEAVNGHETLSALERIHGVRAVTQYARLLSEAERIFEERSNYGND